MSSFNVHRLFASAMRPMSLPTAKSDRSPVQFSVINSWTRWPATSLSLEIAAAFGQGAPPQIAQLVGGASGKLRKLAGFVGFGPARQAQGELFDLGDVGAFAQARPDVLSTGLAEVKSIPASRSFPLSRQPALGSLLFAHGRRRLNRRRQREARTGP